MALALTLANINPAGITDWRIKDASRPDDAYYSLLAPSDFDLSVDDMAQNDSRGRPIPRGKYLLNMSAKCLVPKTQANFLDLLASIGMQKKWYHRVVFVDGKIIGSAESDANVDVGIKWVLTCDTARPDWTFDIKSNRFINQTERTAFFTTANQPVVGTPGASDTLYAARNMAISDAAPSGVTNVEIGSSYAENAGSVMNAKFTAENVTYADDRGVEFGHLIKINFEADVMQTAQAEILEWDDQTLSLNDIRITFVNAWVATLSSNLGMKHTVKNAGDIDGQQVIHLTSSGTILPSGWAALWA